MNEKDNLIWQIQDVVVGFGGAGAVSAIAAKDAGADVGIVEKNPS